MVVTGRFEAIVPGPGGSRQSGGQSTEGAHGGQRTSPAWQPGVAAQNG